MKKILAAALVLALCLSLTACGQGERYPEIADMLDEGDYESAVLAIYEMYLAEESTSPSPTEDPVLQRKYNTLTGNLSNLARYVENHYDLNTFSFNFFDGTQDHYYQGMEAVAWLYDTARELGDHEDAAAIAARFTVLEDVALRKTYTYSDVLQNIMQTHAVYYVYGADGTVIAQNDDPYLVSDHFGYNYGTPEYTYDENGLLTTLRWLSGETVNAIIDYTHNTDGTVATEHYLDRTGNEFTITYAYDENGRKHQAAGVPCSEHSDSTMTVTYHYDDAGLLVREEGIPDSWTDEEIGKETRIVAYTYDEAGRLVSVRKTIEYSRKENADSAEYIPQYHTDVRVWEFTYDEYGRLIRNTYAAVGRTDLEGGPADHGYRTYVGETTYGTYYVYTPEAE